MSRRSVEPPKQSPKVAHTSSINSPNHPKTFSREQEQDIQYSEQVPLAVSSTITANTSCDYGTDNTVVTVSGDANVSKQVLTQANYQNQNVVTQIVTPFPSNTVCCYSYPVLDNETSASLTGDGGICPTGIKSNPSADAAIMAPNTDSNKMDQSVGRKRSVNLSEQSRLVLDPATNKVPQYKIPRAEFHNSGSVPMPTYIDRNVPFALLAQPQDNKVFSVPYNLTGNVERLKTVSAVPSQEVFEHSNVENQAEQQTFRYSAMQDARQPNHTMSPCACLHEQAGTRESLATELPRVASDNKSGNHGNAFLKDLIKGTIGDLCKNISRQRTELHRETPQESGATLSPQNFAESAKMPKTAGNMPIQAKPGLSNLANEPFTQIFEYLKNAILARQASRRMPPNVARLEQNVNQRNPARDVPCTLSRNVPCDHSKSAFEEIKELIRNTIKECMHEVRQGNDTSVNILGEGRAETETQRTAQKPMRRRMLPDGSLDINDFVEFLRQFESLPADELAKSANWSLELCKILWDLYKTAYQSTNIDTPYLKEMARKVIELVQRNTNEQTVDLLVKTVIGFGIMCGRVQQNL